MSGQSERNSRLDALVERYPMERVDAEWWTAIVGAWFLCGIIRFHPEVSDAGVRSSLSHASGIVWC